MSRPAEVCLTQPGCAYCTISFGGRLRSVVLRSGTMASKNAAKYRRERYAHSADLCKMLIRAESDMLLPSNSIYIQVYHSAANASTPSDLHHCRRQVQKLQYHPFLHNPPQSQYSLHPAALQIRGLSALRL